MGYRCGNIACSSAAAARRQEEAGGEVVHEVVSVSEFSVAAELRTLYELVVL
jgi:hypothetical protein